MLPVKMLSTANGGDDAVVDDEDDDKYETTTPILRFNGPSSQLVRNETNAMGGCVNQSFS